jgi:hypothetical protein
VLHLLLLLGLFVLIWVVLAFLLIGIIGGAGWDDLRSLLLYRAYSSFTFGGDVIPGMRPGRRTRLVIRAVSREDDARRALVTQAIATAEQRRRPRSGAVRLRLRMMRTRMGQASSMSLALRQASAIGGRRWEEGRF